MTPKTPVLLGSLLVIGLLALLLWPERGEGEGRIMPRSASEQVRPLPENAAPHKGGRTIAELEPPRLEGRSEPVGGARPSILDCLTARPEPPTAAARLQCLEELAKLPSIELADLIASEVCGTYRHGIGQALADLARMMPLEESSDLWAQLTRKCGHFSISDALFEAWNELYLTNPGLMADALHSLDPNAMFSSESGLTGIYLAGFGTLTGDYPFVVDLLHVGATGAYGGTQIQIDMALLQVAHEFEGDDFLAFMNDVVYSPHLEFEKDQTGMGSSLMHILFDPENADSVTPDEQLVFVLQLLEHPFFADSTAPHVLSQMKSAPAGISDAEWSVVHALASQHIGLSVEEAFAK